MDKKSASGIIGKIMKYMFPTDLTCNACGREIFKGLFCDACDSVLPRNDIVTCGHCGRRVFNHEEFCNSCKGRDTYFDKARSAFVYAPPISDMITSFKYGGKRYLAEIFAREMESLYYKFFYRSDFAIYTPMTSVREKERGYNQARLIAEELCAITELPLKDGIIIKVKETERQATLNSKERRENLKGSFKVSNKCEVLGKTILLIDDVMTTGATVETIAERLKKAGAECVFVLTVASVSAGEEGKALPPHSADK